MASKSIALRKPGRSAVLSKKVPPRRASVPLLQALRKKEVAGFKDSLTRNVASAHSDRVNTDDIFNLVVGVQDFLRLSDEELGVVIGLRGGGAEKVKQYKEHRTLSPPETLGVVERVQFVTEIIASAGLLGKCHGRPDRELTFRVLSEERSGGSLLNRIKSGSVLSLLSAQEELFVITGGVWVRNDAKGRT